MFYNTWIFQILRYCFWYRLPLCKVYDLNLFVVISIREQKDLKIIRLCIRTVTIMSAAFCARMI